MWNIFGIRGSVAGGVECVPHFSCRILVVFWYELWYTCVQNRGFEHDRSSLWT